MNHLSDQTGIISYSHSSSSKSFATWFGFQLMIKQIRKQSIVRSYISSKIYQDFVNKEIRSSLIILEPFNWSYKFKFYFGQVFKARRMKVTKKKF